jgi:hypothetical protein
VTQPTKVSVTTTFASDEANGVSGRSTVKTSGLDGMMQAFKTCTDAIIDNLALIQRDDGAILDGTVRTWTLGSDVLALIASGSFTIRGGWVTATAYVLGDVVLQSGTVYICMIAHTAGTFAADLAAGRWGAITNTPTLRPRASRRRRRSLLPTCRPRFRSSTTKCGRCRPSSSVNFSMGYKP